MAAAGLRDNTGSLRVRILRDVARDDMMAAIARHHGRPVAIVNLVGANDDLIFDGDSGFYDATGTRTGSCARFEDDLCVVEVGAGKGITVKVYLKEDVVENQTGEEQYIFIAGQRMSNNSGMLEWSCGASGVDTELLPEDCQG